MQSFTPQEVEINRSGISLERLDGEVVIISFETGKYFHLNGPGADILYMIDQGIPQAKWEATLGKLFPSFRLEPVEFENFLLEAISERLLIFGSAKTVTDILLPNDYSRSEWTVPRLTVFDDLADLLLVDPIHETGAEGWPIAKND